MQVAALTLRKHRQGALPLVHHLLHRLQVPQLLAAQVAPPRYVQALELLLKSILLQPKALYRVQRWAQDYDAAYRPTEPLSDDVLGRALDRLFEADRASLLTALVLQAVRAFEVDTRTSTTQTRNLQCMLTRPRPASPDSFTLSRS